MPWQASGAFSRLFSWVNDAAAGFDILASRMDADTNDITQGLAMARVISGPAIGVTAPSGNLPMGGFKHINAALATAPTDYARFDQIMPLSGGSFTGPITVPGLTVNGTSTLNGVLNVNGGVNATTLAASGNGYIGGSLTVANAAEFTAGGSEIVTGLTVLGALNANGGLTTTNLSASGNAGVGGTLTAGAVTAGGVTATNANITGTLTAGALNAGNTNISGTLVVANAAEFTTGGSFVVGAFSVGAGLAVTGGATIDSATVNGMLNAAGGLTVNMANIDQITAPSGAGGLVVNNGLVVNPDGGQLVAIECNRDIQVNGDIGYTGALLPNSDRRLKAAIAPYQGGLAAIRELRPQSWAWNGQGGTKADGRRFYGLIADEVEPVLPEMVGQRPDGMATLDYQPLLMALVNATNELASRVEAVERGAP